MREIFKRLKRIIVKLRLTPIRVFCFHQVSDTFDASTMYPEDWLQMDDFKKRVLSFKNDGYTFVSLIEASWHIKHDFFRIRKYAVLTADDGWASLKNILPWLNEQHIPITLFINPAYLDGKHYRNHAAERYLSEEDLNNIDRNFPDITIASHGWEHVYAPSLSAQEFSQSVDRADAHLQSYTKYAPFFAYAWGKRTNVTNNILHSKHLIPVLMDGKINYDDESIIHRELL